MSGEYRLLFGYRQVRGVPMCPCADPGNYLLMEQRVDDPLSVRFTCWCGRTVTGKCDDQAELDDLLAQNGVTPSQADRQPHPDVMGSSAQQRTDAGGAG